MRRVLVLLCVGLSILVIGLVRFSPTEQAEPEAEAAAITETNVGGLNAAVLVHEDEMAAVYVYDGKIGLMDAGENIRLSERMLKAFLYQASHLNAARVFDEHEPWREYGLETPYATLILMGKDGTRQRIYIGDQAAYGEGRYVRAEGDERLYLLDGIGAEMMDYGPDDFRDIQIFPSLTTESLSKLTRITIEHGENRLDIRGVQKDGAILFIMEEPFHAALNWQAVTEKLVLPIAAVQKEAYISDAGMEHVDVFRQEDVYTLEMDLDGQRYRIVFAPSPDGQGLYCGRDGEPDIIRIKTESADFLNLTAADLMDGSLYTKKAADVADVTVSGDGFRGTLTLQGQGEQLCSFADQQRFNQAETIRLYRQFTMLPPAQRLDDGAALSRSPLVTLIFSLRDGTEDVVRCIPVSDGYCAVVINDEAAFTTYASAVREIVNAARDLFTPES